MRCGAPNKTVNVNFKLNSKFLTECLVLVLCAAPIMWRRAISAVPVAARARAASVWHKPVIAVEFDASVVQKRVEEAV